MIRPGWRMAACLTFAFASATDLVDGWIARRYGLVTSFGKVADPIADKALTGTALVLLSWYDRMPWWVTVLILTRELGVTALRFWVIRHGVIAGQPGRQGQDRRSRSWRSSGTCGPLPGAAGVGPVIMGAAVVVTVRHRAGLRGPGAAAAAVGPLIAAYGGRPSSSASSGVGEGGVEVTGTSPVDATDRHGRATGGAAEVVRELAERRASLAVVESLTGGLLAATIVDVPGASGCSGVPWWRTRPS